MGFWKSHPVYSVSTESKLIHDARIWSAYGQALGANARICTPWESILSVVLSGRIDSDSSVTVPAYSLLLGVDLGVGMGTLTIPVLQHSCAGTSLQGCGRELSALLV